MARYSFYIDGFNVYYSLQGKPHYRKYKWLNYRKLAEAVVSAHDTVTGVFYFTAAVKWKRDSFKRHERYIKLLRSVGVETIRGKFKTKQIRCHLCRREFTTHEEKRTDVNIALRVVSDAIDALQAKKKKK